MPCWFSAPISLRAAPRVLPKRRNSLPSAMRLRPTRPNAGPMAKRQAGRAKSPVCNLYSLNKTRDGIARFFRVSHNRAAGYEPLPAIFPGRVAPVVRQSADGEREIGLMSWGFVLLQNGRAPRRVTNV